MPTLWRRLFLLAVAALGLACSTANLRPAATPALLGLHRHGGRDTEVGLDDDGLDALPATALALRVQAPWPGDLQVSLEGVALTRVAGVALSVQARCSSRWLPP